MRFTCTRCLFDTHSFLTLIKHYRYGHDDQPVHCNISGCQKLLKTTRQYLAHIKSKHKEFWTDNCSSRIRNQNVEVEEEDIVNENVINDGAGIGSDNEIDAADDDAVEIDVAHCVSSVLLGLREEHKSTGSACSYIANSVSDLFAEYREDLSKKINTILQNSGADMEVMNNVSQVLDESQYEKSFFNFSSTVRLQKYVAENFDFVQPVEYVLGRDENGADETIQYIPILDTMRALLKKDEIFSEVYNGHFSQDHDLLLDYCDGLNFKNNPLFSTKKMALQIQLYYDEMCVANPLGNKAKQMKIGAFYFILGNISPKYRSKLHIIQLATLCLVPHIQKYDYDAIIAPLIRDIKILEAEGLSIWKDDVEYTLYGTVSFISADNLGAHMIGGFQLHFNHGRICRGCNVTKRTLKDHFNCKDLEVRSRATYDLQVQRVQQNRSLRYVYGILCNSPFNQLEYFHVTTGLPFDIAHDLFEGAIPEVIYMTVKHCVQQGYFSLQFLNSTIKTFDYGQDDVCNKPSPMSSDLGSFRVKQTAAQAWCLLRLLPIMIGHGVPFDDTNWLVLLLFLDVVEYCMAPKVNKVVSNFLAYLIEMFLSAYYDKYNEITMKPKFHFLTHYPKVMFLYGPLVHCWTLRFEGKHLMFKETAWRTKNRKNILKTLAEKHEYYQAWRRSRSENFLTEGTIKHTGGEVVFIRMLSQEMQRLVLPLVGKTESVYRAKKVSFSGTWYKSGSAVVLAKTDESYKFGISITNFIISGVVYLACRTTITTDYIHHEHAYAISDLGQQLVKVKPTDLADYHPLSVYDTEYTKLIVLRHHIL